MDSKNKSYNPAEISDMVKSSRVFHIPRIKVAWGGYSLIQTELNLLMAATSQGRYEHYHLLSGSDLPIKKQEYIAEFFENHHGMEFVSFQPGAFSHEDRVSYYHFFTEYITNRTGQGTILGRLNYISIRIQMKLHKALHCRRNKRINFKKGSQWFSITDELARYILSKENWIKKVFHNTFACDEIFLQTIIFDSPFMERLDKSYMRLIDWQRGAPYVFHISDLDMIKDSPMLFARKFDENVDTEIIRRVYELYS